MKFVENFSFNFKYLILWKEGFFKEIKSKICKKNKLKIHVQWE